MNRPFVDEYWKAAEKEVIILKGIGALDEFEHEDDMNIINGIWIFKCKQFLMVMWKSSKPAFVLVKISSWKELIFFKSMPLLYNGPHSPWCWFLITYLAWDQSNWFHCCYSSCYSWRRWESLCGDASWFQAVWSKQKVQGPPSQEISPWLASKSLSPLEISH